VNVIWTTASLGEISDRVDGVIQTGPFGSQLHESDYSADGKPVVMPKDIQEGRITEKSIARVSETHVARLSRHILKAGDIVYARRGDIGRRAIITERESGWLCGTGCLRISLGDTILDPKYLFYFLGDATVTAEIAGKAIGATLPNLNTTILRDVIVRFPELTVQRNIAGILSAYDDLIEVNVRRIAILEEMARRLFDEWFVKFRFPGHVLIDSNTVATQALPKGWRIGNLQDVIVLQRGFDLPTSARFPGPYPVVAATGIHGTHAESKVSGPCVVTGRSGSLGTVLHIDEDFWPLNTTLWGKEFPLGSTYYAFFVLQGINLRDRNTGAAVPTLNQNDIHKLPVPVPLSEIITIFDGHIAPLFKLKKILTNSNKALRRVRDLLLPKLISGEIDLSGAEREIERTVDRAAAE
jgi:type I restriction enzyme, S subunit